MHTKFIIIIVIKENFKKVLIKVIDSPQFDPIEEVSAVVA